ncbi:histidine--tRNA ligase [Neofamilia massiliensis]|uniref:histidine--tRNA ligase n=1 Tax=Neofamilia massiliensis TaxID=1673724 RepID=UPI0006BB6560|nr:histidine--tRNA ligase [Neofamilia massiliensis]
MTNIVKPSILAGFMELLPQEQIQFNKMKDTIRRTYESFGFLPLDTPVMEKADVLLAKGGGETEKQVYRFEKGKSDIALRFDLTVPLARYVAQHYSELSFPFRRYHIAKVYRGERNQRGRFREFYQCDIDIIGDRKLAIINDAEIPAIIYNVFKNLEIGDFTIRINNRKLLKGFYGSLGIEDSTYVLRIIDKMEKIGLENVKLELKDLGLDDSSIEAIIKFLEISGSNLEKIKALKDLNIENETFLEGLDEIEKVFEYLKLFNVPEANTEFDLTIARGLDYYTGTVYETKLNDHPEIGSICSGGRYDNLASHYTKQSLPGVGISIGLTRLFYQLQEAGIIKTEKNILTDLLIIPFEGFEPNAIELLSALRKEGVTGFINAEAGKLGKKMKYADDLNIKYTILIGQDEVDEGKYMLRNMETGDQEKLSVDEIIACIKKEKMI